MPEDLTATTAVINISPESDLAVLQLVCEGNKLREYAIARTIATDADLKSAVDDLSLIAKVKKALVEKKAEYVKPVKAHLDAFNAAFAMVLTPVEDADRITRQKYDAYRAEQKRRYAEAEEINRKKIELAKQEAAFNGTGEVTIDTTPVVAPVPIARVQTDVGSAGITHNWKGEVIDFAALPNEYKIVDYVKLGKVIRAGLHSIPGVRIWEEEGIRVSTR